MKEQTNASRRRARFPLEFLREIDRLPSEERHRRMIEYIEEHGEDVGPGDGYGPNVGGSPERKEPPEQEESPVTTPRRRPDRRD